jgi:hypothetical protein
MSKLFLNLTTFLQKRVSNTLSHETAAIEEVSEAATALRYKFSVLSSGRSYSLATKQDTSVAVTTKGLLYILFFIFFF